MHGGDAWAVYLAVDEDADAESLTGANLLLADLGYPSGTGDLGCDIGGAELLGVDPETRYYAVAVYFHTEGEATRFVTGLAARGHAVEGMGLVRTICLD